MIWISLPHNWKEINSFKGRTIRKLIRGGGGGGRAKYNKNIRTRENKMKKIHARQLIRKKYSCYDLKKEIIQGI